jgi:hypothetical protein
MAKVSGESITASTRGERDYGALPNRRLAANFGLGDFPTPRLVNESAARAKELGENKGVTDNGLTNTN